MEKRGRERERERHTGLWDLHEQIVINLPLLRRYLCVSNLQGRLNVKGRRSKLRERQRDESRRERERERERKGRGEKATERDSARETQRGPKKRERERDDVILRYLFAV
jgi:hypothetical protein